MQRLLEQLKGSRFLAVLGASGQRQVLAGAGGSGPRAAAWRPPGEPPLEFVVIRPGAHPLDRARRAAPRARSPGWAMQRTLDALATDTRTLAPGGLVGARPDATRTRGSSSWSISSRRCSRSAGTRRSARRSSTTSCMPRPSRAAGPWRDRDDARRLLPTARRLSRAAQQLAAHQYARRSAQPSGLRQAIEEPAHRVGLELEARPRRTTILSDVARAAGRPAAARARAAGDLGAASRRPCSRWRATGERRRPGRASRTEPRRSSDGSRPTEQRLARRTAASPHAARRRNRGHPPARRPQRAGDERRRARGCRGGRGPPRQTHAC